MKQTNTFLFAIVVTAAFASGASPKISVDVETLDPANTVDVIVQYRQPPTEVHHKKVTDRGGRLKTELGVVNSGHYAIFAGKLADLANDPDVAFITPDRPVKGMLDYANSTVGADIALKSNFDGTGIGIAVIDSGVRQKNDLAYPANTNKSRVVYSEDFTGKSNTGDPFGHGTHVAGIVAGSATASTGKNFSVAFRGMAPNATVVSLRVLDENGAGTDSAVIAAIQRAIALKSQYNIRVINLSLGRGVLESYKTDPLCLAVEQAWKAGIVVVVAAGNSGRDNSAGTLGYGTILSPGNDPYVITVGAMKTMNTASRADDLIASYSSKGPTAIDHIVKPDILAPGNRVISLIGETTGLYQLSTAANLVPCSYYTTSTNCVGNSTTYYRLSGTSMAAPMVSGSVALMLQKQPTLTPDQVKARLMKTASKTFPRFSTATDPVTGLTYTSQYDIFTVGAGYLDVWAALNNTDLATKPAMSPIAVYNSSTGKVTLQNSATSGIWGDNGIWGDHTVWGNYVWLSSANGIWGDNGLWGANGIWGDKTLLGFNGIWGDKTLSGTTAPASASALTGVGSVGISIAINGEN